VLDLRDDPGGLLNGAVGVAAAFLPKGALVVYTEGRTPDSKMHLTASLANYANIDGSDPLAKLPAQAHHVPMVVLVNGGSASASEIVAGALQDSKRALILGTQTFGKGSVQSILPLSNDGGIRLTTSRYFTPSGRSIQAKGITPDILADDGNTTYQAFSVREADLEGHLANPNGDSSSAPKAVAPVAAKVQPAPAKTPRIRSDSNEPDPANDYQLGQALNTLKVQQLLIRKAN
jgi:carboxyl-terminal processing protease